MQHRYFHPELIREKKECSLSAEEVRHAVQVMRVRPSQTIELFDGQNHQATATVQTVSKRLVTCVLGPIQTIDREPTHETIVSAAMPKGDRARVLVEKLTELGVSRLIPLVCERSQWKLATGLTDKLRRTVIAACKQSGRNRLMVIDAPQKATNHFKGSPNENWAGCRIIAHPSGQGDFSQIPSGPIQFAIGPEGGFTDSELTLAIENGWDAVSLGPRLYRIETAAMVLATAAALASHPN